VMGDSAKYNVEREADHVFEVRESVRKSQQWQNSQLPPASMAAVNEDAPIAPTAPSATD
jgi:hypothetical protein